MLLPISPQQVESVLESIRSQRKPYMVKMTSSSQTIRNADIGYVASQFHLGRGALSNLIHCRSEILKRAKTIDLTVPAEVRWCAVSDYFVSDQPPRKMFVSEFDLSHAYWRAALMLGFISEVTYHKFLKFKSKRLRLIALGMLAKKQQIVEYDATGKETDRRMVVDEIGQQIFKRISSEVAGEMQRLSQVHEQDFRFYWMDNLVVAGGVRSIESPYEWRRDERLMDFKYKREHFCFQLASDRRFILPQSALQPGGMYEVPF